MASTCPYCNKEVDYLINWCQVYEAYKAVLDTDDILDTSEGPIDKEAGDDSYYSCPECRETIAEDHDVARKFLKVGL